jgi:bifunctional enzyme CysN/CysC
LTRHGTAQLSEASTPATAGADLLRFIACGSVDDGKSTLIGRLLHETGAVPDDALAALGDAPDFALLLDGLSAEREQGITIDVAWRMFATPNRAFIVADAPGHEHYTRNMATGASRADLALILVDARKGVLTQTRRHSWIARLLGIRHFVLAANKMDLVGHDQARFEAIRDDFAAFAQSIGIESVEAIPLSALAGENIVTRARTMAWFQGPTLLEHLESVSVESEPGEAPFRMPVQLVSRPDQDFRGFAGTVAQGAVRAGDAVLVQPAGLATTVKRIVTFDGELQRAEAGQSITLELVDQVDCARGDVIAAADAPLEVADQFEATIIWMDGHEMLPGRSYWLKLGTDTVSAQLNPPKYEIDVDTQEHLAARTLALNGIGVCTLATDRPIPFAPYEESRALGGFILIDRETNATAGAGMIRFALRRSHNLQWQELDVSKEKRAALKQQQPVVLWFTGLSGAGKSTIANLVEKKLAALGRHTFLLDGDNVRHGLNRDLGFTEADRVENIRRVGEVAKLMTEAGLIVLTAFISPFRAERRTVREMFDADEFIEVHVDAPLDVAEARDPKGLYAKARAGELANFTGIDSPYEPPEAPEIRIDTTQMSAEQAASLIVERLLG